MEADRFEEFWRVYPRRTAKPAAKKSWERCVIKMKLDADAIIEGAKTYADAKRGTEAQYIAHPATWLNNQRWLDENPTTQDATPENRVVDTAAIEAMSLTQQAHDLKKKLIERTRWENWDKIERAAERVSLSPQELWGAMRSGSIGVDYRAWRLACAEILDGKSAPNVVPLEAKHWLDGKERAETRKLHIRGMMKERWSPLAQAPMITTTTEKTNERL